MMDAEIKDFIAAEQHYNDCRVEMEKAKSRLFNAKQALGVQLDDGGWRGVDLRDTTYSDFALLSVNNVLEDERESSIRFGRREISVVRFPAGGSPAGKIYKYEAS